ncbi:hypothetical protein J6590_001488 [Homalodisca vitripennis]|nr:hypothetical protein J6590_001488 [Homalodisca vitripennis]
MKTWLATERFHKDEELQALYISRITEGGVADRNGKLQVGDRIVSINGVDMDGARHEQAVAMLTSLERYMRLVCEREVVVPRGAPRPSPSPVLNSFGKPAYTSPYLPGSTAGQNKPEAAVAAPRPMPRKLTSTSSVTSDTEPPQVGCCLSVAVQLCLSVPLLPVLGGLWSAQVTECPNPCSTP